MKIGLNMTWYDPNLESTLNKFTIKNLKTKNKLKLNFSY